MKKLPPEFYGHGDETPSENSIVTVDLGDLTTIRVPTRDGHSLRALPHIDVSSLVRARQGARESAFSECRRTCKRWTRGAVMGALMALVVVAAVVAFVYCWTRYWR